MALMQPRVQAVDGQVPHAMDMPETNGVTLLGFEPTTPVR